MKPSSLLPILILPIACTPVTIDVLGSPQTAQAVARFQPVDILFVVDNSGSMADEQEALARNFRAFIEVAARNPLNDYRIAVISTDAGGNPADTPDGPEAEGLVDNRFGPAPYHASAGQVRTSCLQLLDTPHGCFRGLAPKVIDSTQSAEAQIAQFAQAVQVGSCGTGNEQPLLAMQLALTKTCNAGFLRPGARLVVVFVSDEEDSSPNADYVQAIVDATGKPVTDIRVAALVGAVGNEAAWCGRSGASCGETTCAMGPPADPETAQFWNIEADACRWCTYFNAPGCCSAKPGARLVEFARALEDAVRLADPTVVDAECGSASGGSVACVVASICDSDFSDSFRRIARDLVVTSRFDITPTAAAPSDVLVTVAGQALVNCATVAAGAACDFAVSADGRTVTITNPARVPGPADAVVVSLLADL
jgi:hypothetical protein